MNKKNIYLLISMLIIFSVFNVIAQEVMENATKNDSGSGGSNNSEVMCAMDVKTCPDGSVVGRTGPSCEFKCPGEKNEDNGGIIILEKTRVDKDEITFIPWKKRGEDDPCLEGCDCHGSVVSCPIGAGKSIVIVPGKPGNMVTMTIDKTEVKTGLELEQVKNREQDKIQLKARLSNGNLREVKIMPDVASERALERLRLKNCNSENNCSIELKEVGNDKDKQLIYELQRERHAKIIGLFKKKMSVQAEVDAETGELIKIRKPWWAFLATEPKE